jgi:hypothetical protein
MVRRRLEQCLRESETEPSSSRILHNGLQIIVQDIQHIPNPVITEVESKRHIDYLSHWNT